MKPVYVTPAGAKWLRGGSKFQRANQFAKLWANSSGDDKRGYGEAANFCDTFSYWPKHGELSASDAPTSRAMDKISAEAAKDGVFSVFVVGDVFYWHRIATKNGASRGRRA